MYLDKSITNQHDTIIIGELHFHVDDMSGAYISRMFRLLWVEAARHWSDIQTRPRFRRGDIQIVKFHYGRNVLCLCVIIHCLSNNKGESSTNHLSVQLIVNIDKPVCLQNRIQRRK